MSSLLQSRTPAQLLGIIAASNALVIIGFSLLSQPAWHRGGQHPLLWCSLAAVVLGLIGSLFAEQALRDGMNSEQWPDSLLVIPRKLTSHPTYSILSGLLIVGTVAYVVTSVVTSKPHATGGAWMFLVPAMTLTRVQGYLRPKRDSAPLCPREQAKPLRSNKWGTPPSPFSS